MIWPKEGKTVVERLWDEKDDFDPEVSRENRKYFPQESQIQKLFIHSDIKPPRSKQSSLEKTAGRRHFRVNSNIPFLNDGLKKLYKAESKRVKPAAADDQSVGENLSVSSLQRLPRSKSLQCSFLHLPSVSVGKTRPKDTMGQYLRIDSLLSNQSTMDSNLINKSSRNFT